MNFAFRLGFQPQDLITYIQIFPNLKYFCFQVFQKRDIQPLLCLLFYFITLDMSLNSISVLKIPRLYHGSKVGRIIIGVCVQPGLISDSLQSSGCALSWPVVRVRLRDWIPQFTGKKSKLRWVKCLFREKKVTANKDENLISSGGNFRCSTAKVSGNSNSSNPILHYPWCKPGAFCYYFCNFLWIYSH